MSAQTGAPIDLMKTVVSEMLFSGSSIILGPLHGLSIRPALSGSGQPGHGGSIVDGLGGASGSGSGTGIILYYTTF
jgi:hypothetical protein